MKVDIFSLFLVPSKNVIDLLVPVFLKCEEIVTSRLLDNENNICSRDYGGSTAYKFNDEETERLLCIPNKKLMWRASYKDIWVRNADENSQNCWGSHIFNCSFKERGGENLVRQRVSERERKFFFLFLSCTFSIYFLSLLSDLTAINYVILIRP